LAALAKLREIATANGATEPEHFVFPGCENYRIDPNKPQKSWRTAWRALVKATSNKREEKRQRPHYATVKASAEQRPLGSVPQHRSRVSASTISVTKRLPNWQKGALPMAPSWLWRAIFPGE
jgi:hypothetical protein